MAERDSKGRFVKGHKFIKEYEDGKIILESKEEGWSLIK